MNTDTELFDYSVVIRTLGTSGEKYHSLLQSVEKQTVKPREVIVVMAHGYEQSPFHTDCERVVWTRKGMVNQRQVGFEKSRSPYLLVVDDDIAFESDFVERQYTQLQASGADCIFPVTGFGGGKNRLKDIRSFLIGSKRYSSRRNPYSLRIGCTAGTIVNTSMTADEPHWCQTANFQCFFLRREMALGVHLEEEMWLEDTGYAWPDDQVFFYKAWLNGFRILLTPFICYRHLDARSGNVKTNKDYKDNYLHQRNITIFWYRFLWKPASGWKRKVVLVCGLAYTISMRTLLYIMKCIVRRNWSNVGKGLDGFFAALKFNRNK